MSGERERARKRGREKLLSKNVIEVKNIIMDLKWKEKNPNNKND